MSDGTDRQQVYNVDPQLHTNIIRSSNFLYLCCCINIPSAQPNMFLCSSLIQELFFSFFFFLHAGNRSFQLAMIARISLLIKVLLVLTSYKVVIMLTIPCYFYFHFHFIFKVDKFNML